MPEKGIRNGLGNPQIVALVAILLGIVGCGSDGDGSGFKPPAGATVDLSGIVSDGVDPVEDATVSAFLAGTPDVPEAITTSNELGEYLLTVLASTPLSRQYSKAPLFATVNTIYRSFGADTAGLDFELLSVVDAAKAINDAFVGMWGVNDKAWLWISIVDSGNEVADVIITTDAIADGGGPLDCDGLYSGLGMTIACDPARTGPMYLAYFDADAEIEILAEGGAIAFAASAPVRVGEITLLQIGE